MEADERGQALAKEEIPSSTKSPPEVEDFRPRHATTGEPLSLLREILVILVVCLAQLFTQAGVGQALASLNVVGDDLNITNQASRSWEIAAYSLTVGTFILIAGRFGDVFGHKVMFVVGFAWFGLWSLLAGVSVYADGIFFDFCRGMQGIGPAIVLPNGIAILGVIYPASPRKDMAFAIFGSTAPGGAVLGATFASIFSQFLWWPWTYWALAIACFIVSLLAWLVIPSSSRKIDYSGLFQRLDALGSVVGVGGLILVNVAWNQGSSIGWTTVYTYILLIVGLIVLAIFAYIEKIATHPLIPSSILSRDIGFVLGCIACGWATFGIWVFYTWEFLEIFREQTPILVSAQFVPAAISGLIAAVTTGYLMSRVHPAWIMLMALLFFATGSILVATAPVKQTYWAQTFVAAVVAPWGMDMSFPAGTLIASAAMPAEHQGLAASLVTTVVNYSISLGLGLGGTVESNVDNDGKALLKGYRGAWYMGIGLSGLGVILAAVFICVSTLKQR
ncbi:MAG: hypothetical protein Q9167_004659 [Letrouitia subvulpina]